MTNRLLFVAGVGAIVLLGAGSIAIVLFAQGSPVTPPAAPAAPDVEPPAPVAPAPASPATASPDPAREAARVAAVAPSRRRPTADSASAWKEVPVAGRPADLGPELAAPVASALEGARALMEPCFREEEQALARGEGPKFDPANPPTSSGVLVLHLQTRAGGLDVVDAEIETLGTSTHGLASCCRQVLKGWPIPAPLATPGRRIRLKYLLD